MFVMVSHTLLGPFALFRPLIPSLTSLGSRFTSTVAPSPFLTFTLHLFPLVPRGLTLLSCLLRLPPLSLVTSMRTTLLGTHRAALIILALTFTLGFLLPPWSVSMTLQFILFFIRPLAPGHPLTSLSSPPLWLPDVLGPHSLILDPTISPFQLGFR